MERLRNPAFEPRRPEESTAAAPVDITRRKKEFQVLIRNEVFRRIRLLASGSPDRWPEAWQELATELGWSMDALQAKMSEYLAEHRRILTDPRARAPSHLKVIEESGDLWRAEQVLIDSEGHHDWMACFEIDLPRSRADERAHLRLTDLRPI